MELTDPDWVSVAPGAEPAGLDHPSGGFELVHESFDDFTATILMRVFRIDGPNGTLIATRYGYDLSTFLGRLSRAQWHPRRAVGRAKLPTWPRGWRHRRGR